MGEVIIRASLSGTQEDQLPPEEPSDSPSSFCLGHPLPAKVLGLYFYCGAYYSARRWGKPSLPSPTSYYSPAALVYPHVPPFHLMNGSIRNQSSLSPGHITLHFHERPQ